MSFITPNNKQNETFNIYGFKNTKGIKICSHNVNRKESKFDETKNKGNAKRGVSPRLMT